MMLRKSSLKIGEVIFDELKDILPVYPLIADHGASFPFAIYKRTALQCENTKDIRNIYETATVDIKIASKTYDESLQLAQSVKIRLEHLRGDVNNICFDKIIMTNAYEDWIDDAYVQTLTFQIRIYKTT